MRKKWRISAIVFERKKKIYPDLKSPTHIGFIGVKKNGSKISHLGPLRKVPEEGHPARVVDAGHPWVGDDAVRHKDLHIHVMVDKVGQPDVAEHAQERRRFRALQETLRPPVATAAWGRADMSFFSV